MTKEQWANRQKLVEEMHVISKEFNARGELRPTMQELYVLAKGRIFPEADEPIIIDLDEPMTVQPKAPDVQSLEH